MPLQKNNKKLQTTNFKIAFWVSLVLIVLIGFVLDHINYNREKAAQRLQVLSEVSTYRTQIESTLVANIQLIRGLGVAIAAEPNLDQARFAQIAAPLFKTSSELRNIAGAPNMVISMAYPLKGNEAAIGLNFLENEKHRSNALKARDTNNIVMAGPLELIQGEQALIAKVPVFLEPDEKFWGLLSVGLDIDKIYTKAGLYELEEEYFVALQGRDGLGTEGDYFRGSTDILSNDPLSFPLHFQGGEWQLYVSPKSGWDPASSSIWPLRFTILTICGMLIWAFVFFLKMLNRQQQSEQMFVTMSNMAQVGAWSFNLENQQVYWSDMTKKIFKYPLDKQPDWPTNLNYFKSGKSRNTIQKLIERAIKHNENYEVELQIINSEGQTVWVLMHGEPEQKNGRCVRIFGSLQNIDTRKRIELENSKIALHNEMLASLTTNDLILTGELSRSKAIITQAICHALKVDRASIWIFNTAKDKLELFAFHGNHDLSYSTAKPWLKSELEDFFAAIESHAVVSATDAQNHAMLSPLTAQYLKPLEIKSMLNVIIPAGSGVMGIVCAEQSSNKRHWTHNEEGFLIAVAALIGSLHSSQQRIETEQQLVTAKETAEQAVKAKSEFLASMSHEIRTPMNGVLGMLNIVKQTQLNKQQKHHIELAQSSAQSLLSIINDILDFSKIEAGKLDIEHVTFNLSKLLGEIVESFALKVEQNNSKLILDATKVTFNVIKSDPNRLRQIINNLLGNAAKFTQDGEVIVTAEVKDSFEGTFLRCAIIDTGIGIKANKQDTLFDSFTQADTSTTRQFGGTGLGLAIVKQLCELMGGEVSATSVYGQGSTFSFTIKVHPVQTEEQLPSHLIKNKKILIIDDCILSSTIASKQLSLWGSNVNTLNNYENCQQQLAAFDNVFDAVLLNYYFFQQSDTKSIAALSQYLTKHHCKLILMAPMGFSREEANLPFEIASIIFKPLTPSDLFDALANDKYIEQQQINTPPQTSVTLSNFADEKSVTVLLVEDNKVNQVVASALLKQAGVNFDIAENGLEAIAKIKEKASAPYQLILMDCQMPEMDGYQATKAIRQGQAGEEYKETIIIALTANAMQGDREKCLAAGMNDYLTKPLDFKVLNPMLQQWLSHQ
ncbi:ATP-binding protein [Pseudoalteromonas sp.]|uniref:ATP-binding protein n=1 Tax=unclassified Pseudoalteromonas TaxID=194690 RepID=UPI003F9898E1